MKTYNGERKACHHFVLFKTSSPSQFKANITAFSGDCMEKAFKDTPKSDLAVNLLE